MLDNFSKKIISDFTNDLRKFVITKLGQRSDGQEWLVRDDLLRNFPFSQYTSLSFEKESWQRRYGVGLETQEGDARDFRIGVYRQYNENTRTGSPRLSQRDRERLNREIRRGERRNAYWEYWYRLDDPYWNWGREEETLSKLRTGEALDPIGQELMTIIEVAAPIIDEHVRRHR